MRAKRARIGLRPLPSQVFRFAQHKEGARGEVFIENHVLSWDRMFISFDITGWLSTLSRIFELRERESFSRLGIFKLLKINLTEVIDVVMYIALRESFQGNHVVVDGNGIN